MGVSNETDDAMIAIIEGTMILEIKDDLTQKIFSENYHCLTSKFCLVNHLLAFIEDEFSIVI